jgi:hypothetical protein
MDICSKTSEILCHWAGTTITTLQYGFDATKEVLFAGTTATRTSNGVIRRRAALLRITPGEGVGESITDCLEWPFDIACLRVGGPTGTHLVFATYDERTDREIFYPGDGMLHVVVGVASRPLRVVSSYVTGLGDVEDCGFRYCTQIQPQVKINLLVLEVPGSPGRLILLI